MRGLTFGVWIRYPWIGLVWVMATILPTTTTTVTASTSATSCERPLEWNRPNNAYSLAEYMSHRDQCTQLCHDEGYCCTLDMGICNKAPCTTGCHLAWTTDTVADCRAQCQLANDADCEHVFDHWDHNAIEEAGYAPCLKNGFDLVTCVSATECGCDATASASLECSSTACERGCELAASLAPLFFHGPSVAIDPHLELDVAELQDALVQLQQYVVNGGTFSQLEAATFQFEAHADLLETNLDALKATLDLIDLYETVHGPLFLNDRSQDGFDRESNGEYQALERTMIVVQQAVMDEVFRASVTVLEEQTESILENCRDFLNQRAWQTARYFPGWVDPPTDPIAVYSVQIHASKPQYYGQFVCFADEPALKPTGMYLTPGGVATITVPAVLVDQGFQIRVGANEADHSAKTKHYRMDRISAVFPITSTTVYVGNPLGGGIYVMVPYGAEEGMVSISISGSVVEAPFFSLTSLHTTTRAEWDRLRLSSAPWADFVTDHFFMQVPTSWISELTYDITLDLMQGRQEAMVAVSELMGIPIDLRNDYLSYIQPDIRIRASAFGVGYPQVNVLTDSGPNGPEPRTDHWMVTSKYLENDVYWHELGHCIAGFDYYLGETEAIVNILYAFVGNVLVGLDFDTAFAQSFADGGFTPDEAMIHWMVTPNFRDGNEMDKSNTVLDEFRYQERGYCKYANLAQLFGGWKAFQKFNELRQLDFINGVERNGLSKDDFRTLQMSRAVGADVTALIHFWGIHPDDPVKLQAEMDVNNLSTSDDVKSFLLRSVNMIPNDNDEFQAFAYNVFPALDTMYCASDKYGCGWFREWNFLYQASDGSKAHDTGRAIITQYFGNTDSIPTSSPTPFPSPQPTPFPSPSPTPLPTQKPNPNPTPEPTPAHNGSVFTHPTPTPSPGPSTAPSALNTRQSEQDSLNLSSSSSRDPSFPKFTILATSILSASLLLML